IQSIHPSRTGDTCATSIFRSIPSLKRPCFRSYGTTPVELADFRNYKSGLERASNSIGRSEESPTELTQAARVSSSLAACCEVERALVRWVFRAVANDAAPAVGATPGLRGGNAKERTLRRGSPRVPEFSAPEIGRGVRGAALVCRDHATARVSGQTTPRDPARGCTWSTDRVRFRPESCLKKPLRR